MKRACHSRWLAISSAIAAFMLPLIARGQADSPPDPMTTSEIAKRFRENQQANYRQIVALGDKAVDALAEVLFDKSLTTVQRFMAANALGDTRSRKAVEPLLTALKDDHYNVRRCA